NVRAVYAAPFFLPLPDAGACGVLVDGWAVLRTGRDAGVMHAVHAAPFPEAGAGGPPDDGNDAPPAALPVLSEPIQWLDAGLRQAAGPTALSSPSDAPSRWAGPCAAWSIPVGARQRGGGRQNWTRAAGACALAAAVWVAGLNLYAYRLAHHGQAIQAHMRDRVKAAFPDLPVVVNPLQQARQQRDAWSAGGDDPDSARFSRTIRASAAVIDNLAGQVQSMRYAGGELVLTLRGGKPASADEAAALAQRASEAGLAATADASGWTLRLDPQAMPPALAARNTPGATAKEAG
ncbi:MAG: type II secretion system protein GspL, partial [Pollutimonas bauzanensis]